MGFSVKNVFEGHEQSVPVLEAPATQLIQEEPLEHVAQAVGHATHSPVEVA
jgi:hypothetical protein